MGKQSDSGSRERGAGKGEGTEEPEQEAPDQRMPIVKEGQRDKRRTRTFLRYSVEAPLA